MSSRLRFELKMMTSAIVTWVTIILLAVYAPWYVLVSVWFGLALTAALYEHFFNRDIKYPGFGWNLLLCVLMPVLGLYMFYSLPAVIREYRDTPKPRHRNFCYPGDRRS